MTLDIGDDTSFERFRSVATSKNLRWFVRQVICDSSTAPLRDELRPQIDTEEYDDEILYHSYLRTLSYLRFMCNLTTLHIYLNPREMPELKYAILATMYPCIAGVWTFKNQRNVEMEGFFWITAWRKTVWPWTSRHISQVEYEILSSHVNTGESPRPGNIGWGIIAEEEETSSIQLKSLTVTNLGDFENERPAQSEAFRRVLSRPGLKTLFLPGNLDQSGIEE